MFEQTLLAKIPLGEDDRLGDPDFKLPFSFVFGDGDWVRSADQGFSPQLIEARQKLIPSCGFHLVPEADHNMHMDNPMAFANAIINDIMPELRLPVCTVAEYAEQGIHVDTQN